MAKIDEYLAKILSSRYGKDVRGAIHDSIDEINKVNEANISTVQTIANTAQGYADDAEDSKDLAEQAVTDAQAQVTLANTARTGAETAEDGAEHFYQETLAIAQALGSALIPRGTVEFANLPSVSSTAVKDGYMWNISDSFTTTSDFVEGAGLSIPMGANVYKVTINNVPKWDILAGSSAQVYTGTEAQIEQAIQQGLLGEGVMINSLDDGDDDLLTTSMISHDGGSLENKLDDIDDAISELNSDLTNLTIPKIIIARDTVNNRDLYLTLMSGRGNISAINTIIDLGAVATPDGFDGIDTVIFGTKANQAITMSYYGGHAYAYSPTYTGNFNYDGIIIARKNRT